MKKIISGIQQMGVGVKNAKEAWKWYRKYLGMDINVFEDSSTAALMLPHTENKPREKYAALAVNLEGGGGFEIWQHLGFEGRYPDFNPQMGDYGILVTKMKSRDVEKAFTSHKHAGLEMSETLQVDPEGRKHYFLKDPYNNIFQIVQEDSFFKKQKSLNGGVYGAVVCVSDIEKARVVYSDILEYDEVVYDKEDTFEDLAFLPGGNKKCRRVLLKHSTMRQGPFRNLLGPTRIELIQVPEYEGKNIYENRIWGEPGYIHLCFDIINMDALKAFCADKGHAFTVDSAESFEMGVAAGRFSYIEDPDGTLIEFVETHKLPIIEKLNWNMKLKGRDPNKPLPNWMINSMRFGRIKD